MKVVFKSIIAIAMFLFMGCGEKSPQDLRTEFEQMAESTMSLAAATLSPNRVPREVLKCTAKRMVDMFSDEEIRLMLDSSFSERLNNTTKIMAIQNKMESPDVSNMLLAQCMAEYLKNQKGAK